MSARSSKAKGRRFQQEIRDKIIEVIGLTQDDVFSRTMGEGGTDVYLSAHGKTLFPYAVECKNVEKLSFWAAWEQTKANTKEGEQPALFVKRNHQTPMVILDVDDFLKLVRKSND